MSDDSHDPRPLFPGAGLVYDLAACLRFFSRLPVPALPEEPDPHGPPDFRTAPRVLPIAGLLSEGRGTEVAAATVKLKKAWTELGCTLPYMGFNLIPLSVIPELRITDRGLVTVPGMQQLPLFEASPT